MQTSDLTACDIQVALQRTSGSDDGDGSAGGLLRELLQRVIAECEFEDGSDNPDVLAAKGSDWSDEFGLRVLATETDDGDIEVTVEWGTGDGYTWCRLQDVLEACASGDWYVPDWWDAEWTERVTAEA